MDELLETPTPKKAFAIRTSLTISLIILVIGSFFFFKDREYLDIGHWWVAGIFVLSLIGVFFGVGRQKVTMSGFMIFMCGLCIYVTTEKIDWTKDYYISLQKDPFLFEHYIQTYPTLEQYLFAQILKLPDWVRFERECGRPVLQNKAIQRQCMDRQKIYDRYRINVADEIRDFLQKMRLTAKMVEKGQLSSKVAYQACIANKNCAPIPLLPKDVKVEDIDPKSDDYTLVRKSFWQLVNGEDLSQEVCSFMVLCDVLMQTGAIEFDVVE